MEAPCSPTQQIGPPLTLHVDHKPSPYSRTDSPEKTAGMAPRAKVAASGPVLRICTVLALTVSLLAGGAAAASAATNDYPYRAQSGLDVTDPWGMTERQCTSFVAWRSHQHGVDIPGMSYGRGAWIADLWDNNAAALGKRVDRTPAVGAFAQWNAHERSDYTYLGSSWWLQAGDQGHIAYVSRVNRDGTVTLEDYNFFGGPRQYGTKTLPAGAVPRYIHFS